MTTSECDVLVIGAGPAGSAAAITLANSGRRVRVLERARFPRDKTCGDALSENAVEELRRLGALHHVTRGPHVEVLERAAILPDGARITRRSQRPGMIVPRLSLDDALRTRAEEVGAEVRQGVTVKSLRRVAGEIVARCANEEHHAPIAVVADGPMSVGHALVGRSKPRAKGLALSATVYMEGVSWAGGEPVAEHYFSERLQSGYGWIFPAVNGLCNVGVYQRADAYELGGSSLDALLGDFIEERADRLADAKPVGGVRSWPLPLCGLASGPIAGEGALLAGDAAGFVDPLSGEGIWQALFSGRVAGEVAAEASRETSRLTPELARRYWLRCGLPLQAHAASRRAIQKGMDEIVERRLYRQAAVRLLLRAGYTRTGSG